MFKNIVIPIDLADKHSLKAVLPIALNFVNAFECKLHFIYIIPDFGMKMIEDYLPKHWIKDQKEKYDEQVKAMISKYIPEEIKVDFYIGRGAVYDEVLNYATGIKADLIMVSAVRPQLRDYMLGPNASKIVRHANISVLVVRE
jgi:nucleotide-binding universal stress UspA family protein